MAEPLSWDRDGADWPLRRHSHFVTVGHLRWHVQHLQPAVVDEAAAFNQASGSDTENKAKQRLWLLHGTGAATHTWRDLAPLLAQHHEVVTVDLPGHGFTRGATDEDLSLPGMARALRRLHGAWITSKGGAALPTTWVGHSAGAAVALEIQVQDPALAPLVISLNGAVLPWGRFASKLFMPLARSLATQDWSARFFAWSARRPGTVQTLLNDTGSVIDARGQHLYQRLADNEHHVRSVLRMMALWELEPLEQALSSLPGQVTLITAAQDRTVPPAVSERAARLIPRATLIALPRWGHLGHEEAPAEWASLMLQAASGMVAT